MPRRRRLFAGQRLRELRAAHGLQQSALAERLAISASYLSQLENDQRPLTNVLIDRLAALFPLDWHDLGTDGTEALAISLREAASDPLFAEPMPARALSAIAEQQPEFAARFIALHEAYRRAGQRLEIVDEALSADTISGARLPWEEVRDWFHLANNYVDTLDRAAEALAARLGGPSPSIPALEQHLRSAHGISLEYASEGTMRHFDAEMAHLTLDRGLSAESRRFQLAHQLVSLALREEILQVIEASGLANAATRQLLFIGLSNYAAGALLMPYAAFRTEARRVRHDIDRLAQAFSVSFEQACHRLSTLQREGARGVPFFFCRVDMAGNITKRHSATRLQFARFGGACPLWIVHEAVSVPDRIQVQLAETPDGVRYVLMAKGLVKPSGTFERSPRRFAVTLGCEVGHADEFIYADGLDLDSAHLATPIGISCRICPREDCDQRAFPPSDRRIEVDPDSRGVVPYRFA